jgi:phosphatidylglycerophosphatase A
MNLSPVHLRERGIPYWKQLLVSGFYTGAVPIGSGTVASALACCFLLIPGFATFWIILPAAILVYFLGVKLAHDVEGVLGPDPSFVTIDEFAGQWLTLASPAVLFGAFPPSGLAWIVIGFFAFRTFDIAKVWPASHFERKPGGLGVMTDDIVAGIYANIATHLIWYGLSWVGAVGEFLG